MFFIGQLRIASFFFRDAFFTVLFFLFSGNAFALGDVREGSIITFGRYPQTESGEVKPIEWRVLEVKDNQAFLLADKGLDEAYYNTVRKDVTWKTSYIREWLNSKFYNAAFNDSEKSRIVITVLKNPDNPQYGTDGGGDTRDRIFLLSLDEVEWYLMYKDDRKLQSTPYAIKNGVYYEDYFKSTMWWLRSPGKEKSVASYVLSDGQAIAFGGWVDTQGLAVRPALWIKL